MLEMLIVLVFGLVIMPLGWGCVQALAPTDTEVGIMDELVRLNPNVHTN